MTRSIGAATDPEPRANPAPLVRVRHARKRFVTRGLRDLLRGSPGRTIHALDDVSFDAAPGQVTALLGPNGAGKTTLISILCDLIRADSGSVRVAGLDPSESSREVRRSIGLVTSNERSFFWRLTGRQNLEFFAALQGVPPRSARRRARELMTLLGLEGHEDRVFRFYSAGMKKRLTLARALLHDPPVLLMDEPTNSLDAAGAESLIELVRSRIREMGKCVLWATHHAYEVEQLCCGGGVRMGGRIRFDDGVDRFRELLRMRSRYVLELDRVDGRMECVRAVAAGLPADLQSTGTGARLRTRSAVSDQEVSRALRALLEAGVVVRSAEAEPASLGTLFTQLAREPGDAPARAEAARDD